MVYTLVTQRPEMGIIEKWQWEGDAIVSDDGSEQRIALSLLPKRNWTGQLMFDSVTDLRRHVAMLFERRGRTFSWPAYHDHVKLKRAASAGASNLYLNPERSDLRVGATIVVMEGTTFETKTISTISSDHITVVGTLANSYTARAIVAPVLTVYPQPNGTMQRKGVDSSATMGFNFTEYGFQDPFDPDPQTLELYNSLPVLNRRPFGNEFDLSMFSGAEITDYGGLPDIRSRWSESKLGFSLQFLEQRVLDVTALKWWRTFADWCKGAAQPFYFPSWREDFTLVSTPAGGSAHATLLGTEYSQQYYSVDSMREVVFTKPNGDQHFAHVSGIVSTSGNDVLTFTPALPAGDWTGAVFSLLYLCRIADDQIVLTHEGLHTIVQINVRTTDG